ncbi:MAG TPA: hypothetical protein VFY71_13360 [Planctomycetota bacterium]|nr:hypothetical protein [Planctomycetota bacterium]
MKPGHRIWRMIRHDIGRKLTAFVLALGVWFVLEGLVLDEQQPLLEVKTFSSMELVDRDRLTASRSTLYLVVPDTLQMVSVQPPTLRLRLQGLKEDVRNLLVFATIEFDDRDLKGEDQAVAERTLGRENFRGRDRNPELTLFRINHHATETVSVILARATTVKITLGPANVTTTGQPARGYHVDTGRILVKQYQVDVSGPRATVEKFRTDPGLFKLAPVAIDGAQRTVSQEVGVPAELATTLKLSQSPIEVTVPIVEDDEELTLVSLPINFKHPEALAKKGLRLVGNPPERCDLRVRGPAPDLRAITAEQLAKRIDLVFDYAEVQLAPGINHEPLHVFNDLPDSVRFFGADVGDEEPKIEFKLEELPGGP